MVGNQCVGRHVVLLVDKYCLATCGNNNVLSCGGGTL